MDLVSVADSLKTTTLLALSDDGAFYPWTVGEILTDKEVKNKKTLKLVSDTDIPSTKIIKVKSSGELLILGNKYTENIDDSNFYITVNALSLSTGKTELTEYFKFDQQSFDPSGIISANVGYISLGLSHINVTSKVIKSTDSVRGSLNYYTAKAATTLHFTPYSYFEIGGDTYQVINGYIEDGIATADVVKESSKITKVIHNRLSTATTYNVTTGTFNEVSTKNAYPAIVESIEIDNKSKTTYNLVILYSNLVVPIIVGDILELGTNTEIKITSIKKSFDSGSWYLTGEV